MSPADSAISPTCGLTVAEVAARLRVSTDKVRGWITRGELRAVNTAASLCGKPRWVVPPEALREFELGRAAGTPAKPTRRRRRATTVEYYPDEPKRAPDAACPAG